MLRRVVQDKQRAAHLARSVCLQGPRPSMPACVNPTMTAPEQQPLARGAVAGLTMLAAIILCGALGALLGAVTGLFAPFLLLGIFVGFLAGFFAVRARFPDL